MGREIRRVPLDFDAPLCEVWEGFLMPRELQLPQCPSCREHPGVTRAHAWLDAIVHVLLTLAEEHDESRNAQLDRPPNPWLTAPWTPSIGRPSPDIIELTGGLAGRPVGPFGHDAIDRWAAAFTIARAAGLPEHWGRCPTCNGRGDVGTDEQRRLVEEWRRTDPPTGEGWQVWETVSEGSPITPVFATAEALVDHLATVGYSGPRGGDGPLRRPAAEALVREGWAPSGFGGPGIGYRQGDRDADVLYGGAS